MYGALRPWLKRPTLYEKTPTRFWNDPHISLGMLEAHLDSSTEAASRKPAFIDRSAAWIASLLPAGALLLDIGCGPGLYASRLSALGLRVTGLDFSERSIAYAGEHDPASRYVVQDYLTMEYDAKFDMVILIWCDYGALIPADRANLLRRVHRALKPGGLFLLDVFTPRYYAGRAEDTSWALHKAGGFWSPEPYLLLTAEYFYDVNIGVLRHLVVEEGAIKEYNIWNTCFTPKRLCAELGAHGFVDVALFANVAGDPFTEDSITLCVLARREE